MFSNLQIYFIQLTFYPRQKIPLLTCDGVFMRLILLPISFVCLSFVSSVLLSSCNKSETIVSDGRKDPFIPKPDTKPVGTTTTLPATPEIKTYTRVLCTSQAELLPFQSMNAFSSKALALQNFSVWEVQNTPGQVKLQSIVDVELLSAGDATKARLLATFNVGFQGQTAIATVIVDPASGSGTAVVFDFVAKTPISEATHILLQTQNLKHFSFSLANTDLIAYAQAKSNNYVLRNLKTGEVKTLPYSATQYFQPLLSSSGQWIIFHRIRNNKTLDLVACQTAKDECRVISTGGRNNTPLYALPIQNTGLLWLEQDKNSYRIMASTWDELATDSYKLIHKFNSDSTPDLTIYSTAEDINLVFPEEVVQEKKLSSGKINFVKLNVKTLIGEYRSQVDYPSFLLNSEIKVNRGVLHSLQSAAWAGQIFIALGQHSGVLAINYLTKEWTSYGYQGATGCTRLSVAPETGSEVRK